MPLPALANIGISGISLPPAGVTIHLGGEVRMSWERYVNVVVDEGRQKLCAGLLRNPLEFIVRLGSMSRCQR